MNVGATLATVQCSVATLWITSFLSQKPLPRSVFGAAFFLALPQRFRVVDLRGLDVPPGAAEQLLVGSREKGRCLDGMCFSKGLGEEVDRGRVVEEWGEHGAVPRWC